MNYQQTLAELAAFLKGKGIEVELQGDPESVIQGLQPLTDAGKDDLSFLSSKHFVKYLAGCQACAVMLQPESAAGFAGNKLLMRNPYAAYAHISSLFDRTPQQGPGIHPSAVIADSADIHATAAIGAHAIVGEGVRIGSGTVIGSGCYIGDRTIIGGSGRIAANVSIYHDVCIGDDVIVHSNTVIGADGFGFANERGDWIKIHQLGGVRIGHRVEIGACSTVDRGALGDTVLEDGVKIDNHVQIAHNVRVGENTALAAFVGVSGSTVIGRNCTFAGQVGIVGHISICDGVHVTGATVVSKSITEPGSYSSGTRISKTTLWRKNAARFTQLEDIAQRLKAVEKKLGD